jgi:organic hydroperoxide reductase OsmC/OhrA
MRAHLHRYETRLSWRGSTAGGYAGYDRTHRVATPPGSVSLSLSADPSFRGDPELPNPEQLLLAAASSCQLLSFLALAARERIDVIDYRDRAEAFMPDGDKPVRITRIVLRPHVLVTGDAPVHRVEELVIRAHHECFIANSVSAEIIIEPEIEHTGEGGALDPA